MPLKVKIKYANTDNPELGKIKQGDWIDLRASETVYITPCKKSNKLKYLWLEIKIQVFDFLAIMFFARPHFEKLQTWADNIFIIARDTLEDLYETDFAPTLIPLGVAMELPKGHEAHVALRSSSLARFGLIHANAPGIIDESYCGDEDWWFLAVTAIRPTTIRQGDRICQFKIVEKMDAIDFKTVSALSAKNRGGHGSTGKK